MRFLKHLAISILFALNAFGGWHDSAPYVAWPATNHLRWVDNVGTYTSESVWTNAGYGEWTNNYTTALIWKYDDGYFKGNFPFYFPDEGYGGSNYWVMNAKDIRLIDCSSALLERHLALGGTSNNFYESILVDTPDYRDWLYRNEVANMATLKTYILANCGSFYYQTNGWTNAIQFNETSLCVRANVPTNFFRYTPARSADSASTVYQRILTNTFVLRQGTNAAHVATNSLVDSAGIVFEASGTNGTIVTRYATNTNIQAGKSLGDYGWDGLRRVITNLAVTIAQTQWGIGYGTNGGYDVSIVITSPIPTVYASIPSGLSEGDLNDSAIRRQAVYDVYGGPPVFPLSELSWSSAIHNDNTYSRTNVAPKSFASHSFTRKMEAYLEYKIWLYWDGVGYWRVDARGTNLDLRGYSYTNYYNASETNDIYSAPMVAILAGTNCPIGGEVSFYSQTNSGPYFLLNSTSFDAYTPTYTSETFYAFPPATTNFGFSDIGRSYTYGGGQVGSDPSPQDNDYSGDGSEVYSNSVSPYTTSGSEGHLHTVSGARSIVKWGFEYK